MRGKKKAWLRQKNPRRPEGRTRMTKKDQACCPRAHDGAVLCSHGAGTFRGTVESKGFSVGGRRGVPRRCINTTPKHSTRKPAGCSILRASSRWKRNLAVCLLTSPPPFAATVMISRKIGTGIFTFFALIHSPSAGQDITSGKKSQPLSIKKPILVPMP